MLEWRGIPGLELSNKAEISKHDTTHTAYEMPEVLGGCPPPAPVTVGYVAYGACAEALAEHLPTGLETNDFEEFPGDFNSLSTFEDALTLNYQLGDHTLTSVTGFYNYHFHIALVNGRVLSDPLITLEFPEKYHQVSQELRIASPVGQPLEYMAGVYFQSDEVNSQSHGGTPFVGDLGIPLLAPYAPIGGFNSFTQSEKVYSVFGSLKWNITDQLNVNAGLRGSHVKKEGNLFNAYGTYSGLFASQGFVPDPLPIQQFIGQIFGALGNVNLGRADQALMPSAGIQYHLDSDKMLYLTYSRGFKAGGFNAQPSGPLANLTYGPEHVNAYELGIKSEWLDGHALANFDVFRSDYKGLQQQINVALPGNDFNTQFVANVAGEVSEGAELELQWAPISELRFSGNLTYLHAYYSRYPDAPQTALQSFCATSNTGGTIAACNAAFPNPVAPNYDLTGRTPQFAPRWSASISADYIATLGNGYRLTTELAPYITSDYYSYSLYPDLPGLNNPGYVRVDGRLGFEKEGSGWSVDLIGKNLTDHTIPVFVALGFASKEPPRSVAIQLRYKYQ
jgi:iron complex outermembrane receptor protein